MPASEKQINFIKSLYNTIQEIAPTLSESDATEVANQLKPHAQTLADALGDEDISLSAANDIITTMLSIKERFKPASSEIRWKKIGNDWCVAGPANKIIVGNEVDVTSRKGVQKVKIGSIVSSVDGVVYAKPYTEDVSHVTPGFYWKENDDMLDPSNSLFGEMTIIEAYKTKKGILVARVINPDGSKAYLGKQGLAGLGEKLTLEEAQQFGRETGICMVCGAVLTDPDSIANGIGPICASKW